MSVERIEEPHQSYLAAAIGEDADDAYVLQPDSGGDDVEVGVTQLVAGKEISVIFVFAEETLHVTQRLAVQGEENAQVADEGCFLYLRLVDGGNAFVEAVKRFRHHIGTEGVAVKQHIIQFAVLHQLLDAAAVVGNLRADTAELVIRHLQHTCEPVHASHVLTGNLHAGLVSGVVIDSRPSMLQRGAQLELETYVVELRELRGGAERLGQAADIMERVITEAVQLVQPSFVHRVVPVYVKELLRHSGNTVHIVGIKGDDTCAEDVRYVTECSIFGTLERQFARQRLLCLDACLYGCDDEPVAFERLMQGTGHHLFHALERRQ